MANVIVVHESTPERTRISRNLQSQGWTVFPVATGWEAVRALGFFAADLLLYSADVADVPAETVPELLGAHKALRRVGFVVLHDPQDAEAFFLAQQAGADRLVRSDVTASQLAAVAADVVATRQAVVQATDAFDAAF